MTKFIKIISIMFVTFFLFLSYSFAAPSDDSPYDPFYMQGQYLMDVLDPNSVHEEVDPFSGYLRIVQTDLFLPGNGGLDLKLMRTYNSSIWGRKDSSYSPILTAYDEKSPLGIGWSMHMGLLMNPFGIGSPSYSGPNNPVAIMPDGSNHVFYRDDSNIFDTTNTFVSKENWRLAVYTDTGFADLWTTDGTQYTFVYNNSVGYTTYRNGSVLNGTKVAQAVRIKKANHNQSQIDIYYTKNQLTDNCYMTNIRDTVGRVIQFGYSGDVIMFRLLSE